MKIIITENQYKKYKHLFEQSVYDEEEPYRNTDYGNDDYNDKEGMRIKGEIGSLPITFEYSEEKVNDNGEIEYYGEITFYGDEFLGVIATDKRGYLLEFDFYSVLSDDEIRLQNVLKEMGLYFEFEHWLDSKVIPQIQD
jgi:hypothetical protein